MERKKRMRLFSGAGTALVFGIVLAANVLGHFLYVRLDLSRGHVYSVSPASKRILRALPDPVLVTAYYSKELPPQVAVVRDYLRDLLKEYVSGSGGKVRAEFVEVGDDPKAREQAIRAGVAPVRFDIFSKEKFEQREGFLGLTLRFQTQKEAIPFIRDSNGLEYDLTSKIKTLASPSKPVLGFVSDQQSLASSSLDQGLMEGLRARYEVKDVSLDSLSVDSGVPSGIGTLCLLGPQGKLSDKALSLLDRYLAGGGSLLIATSSKKVQPRAYAATALETGLDALLAKAGLSLRPALVMDAQSQMIQVSSQQGPFMMTNVVQYPPLVVANDLSRTNPVTKDIDAVMLPFVSPISTSAPQGKAAVEALARSSKASWIKAPGGGGFLRMDPFDFPRPEPADEKGPFVLAAGVSWPRGRLALVGTYQFLDPQMGFSPAAGSFFMNLVDWLGQDADLIAIRSKEVAFHPLREVSAPVKTMIRWLDMLLPTLLAVGLGLWRWKRRSGLRSRHAAEFAPKSASQAEAPSVPVSP